MQKQRGIMQAHKKYLPSGIHLPSGASSLGYALLAKRYLIAAGLALFTIWIVFARSPDINHVRNFMQINNNINFYSSDKWLGSRDKFVERAVDRGIFRDVDAYDGTKIRQLCSRTEWREGVYVSCDKIAGGIGNLKMRLLGCLRYTIEAGAQLITPVIHPRQAFQSMDGSFGWDVDLPLAYMFDIDHFYDTLHADCPQLKFVNESDPSMNVPPKPMALPFNPKSLQPTTWGFILTQPELWRAQFDFWLNDFVIKPRGAMINNLNPVRLSFDDGVQFSWNTAYDGDDFKRDFAHLAQFPRNIREVAGRVLYRLYQKTRCLQDPGTISRGCFLGVHIRTEEDAAMELWDSYETQLFQVREQLLTNQLSVLYVATGKRSDVERLRRDLADIRVMVNESALVPVRVIEKWDLVDEGDTMRMDELTWDQAAVVDYEIMLRASRFTGIDESSWSWMIALSRHRIAGGVNPYEAPTTFEDGLSILYGPIGSYRFFPEGMYC